VLTGNSTTEHEREGLSLLESTVQYIKFSTDKEHQYTHPWKF